MIMGNHTILSLNVKGLNSPFKRASVLDFLHRHNIDVALLQETHLRPKDVSRMQNKHYKPIVASGDGSHTKGVLIDWYEPGHNRNVFLSRFSQLILVLWTILIEISFCAVEKLVQNPRWPPKIP